MLIFESSYQKTVNHIHPFLEKVIKVMHFSLHSGDDLFVLYTLTPQL